MFYHSSSGRREYYEEHLELASGQILEIFLACDVTDESRGKIKELLEDEATINVPWKAFETEYEG